MKTPDDLEKLSLLLDDEDDEVAVNVIAALLERQDELGDLPARLQESSNELVRRRAHQLQSAITFRQRRQEFAAMLNAVKIDFFSGLVLLHVLWFNRDSRSNITAVLEAFAVAARRRPLLSLEDARALMCRFGFSAELESTIHPENYCIGTVIFNRSGAASLLMGLLKSLMVNPKKFFVVRFCGEFALFDGKNSILLGQGDWRVCRISSIDDLEFFSFRDILHCAGNMLFSSAVNSDNFRHVLTLAQSLTGAHDAAPLGELPYPYKPS